MSKRDDGGPAYPTGDGIDHQLLCYPGMSLRDYFAGQALQGLLAESSHPQSIGSVGQAKEFAQGSYELADAMIAERNK